MKALLPRVGVCGWRVGGWGYGGGGGGGGEANGWVGTRGGWFELLFQGGELSA